MNNLYIYNYTLDTSSIQNVLLIHNKILNHNLIYDNSNSNTLAIIYSVYSNSNDLNTLLKNKFRKINRLGIVFYDPGLDNCITFLNNTWLFTTDDLKEGCKEYSVNMAFIISLIKDFNIQNIDFLACNTLQYSNWSIYYKLLISNTNVVIYESNNNTENIKYDSYSIIENTYENFKNIYFTKSVSTISGTGQTIYLQQALDGFSVEYSIDLLSWTIIDWCCTIINTNPVRNSILTIKQNSNLTISDKSYGNSVNMNKIGYFQIGSEYIIFDGNNYKIIINELDNYVGLINNGNSNLGSGYNNITLQNININSSGGSTLADGAGWIGQSYFGNGSQCFINKCINNGDIIGNHSGGIFGSNTGCNSGKIIAENCYSTGNILGESSGGIFGGVAGSNNGNTKAENCFSTGDILGELSGGIFGGHAGCNYGFANAEKCYSIGDISGKYSGGIFGVYAGSNYGKAIAENCYPIGIIQGYGSGGIFGAAAGNRNGNANAENCYSTGDILGDYSGGIFGDAVGNNNGSANAINCYSTGIVVDGSGGIFGSIANDASDPTYVNANNCSFNVRITGGNTLPNEINCITYE